MLARRLAAYSAAGRRGAPLSRRVPITLVTATLLIASLLVLISLLQPAARRLGLPYTVLLAFVGVAIGGVATFLLYTPLTNSLNSVVEPLVHLPFGSSTFLIVFLPLLVFQAALEIDIRELFQDAAPVLMLAIVAVLVSTAAVGIGLWGIGHVLLPVGLLIGAIVATTDPAAVISIFRDLGAPSRLIRLVEGEALLNDAAAIVLFSVLLDTLAYGTTPGLALMSWHFVYSFVGGVVLGTLSGRLVAMAMSLMGDIRTAEMTLSLALPYLVYIIGDEIGVSGVVAVVTAALSLAYSADARIKPGNFRYMKQAWEQIGFWAGSLIFIFASLLVPKLLGNNITLKDLELLAILIVTALAARALVLFALLPVLSTLKLSQTISSAYKLAITWGGLRGAVTLALALAVTEDTRLPADIQHLVAVLATGFVLFTLLVNGLTLKPVIHFLGLDQLSPLDAALRSRVLALAFGRVQEEVQQVGEAYELAPKTLEDVIAAYKARAEALAPRSETDQIISDGDRVRIGLVSLANQERQLILDYHAQGTVFGEVNERLLTMAGDLSDAARTEGRAGYNRVARSFMVYSMRLRVAHTIHRRLGIERPLRRRLTRRFEGLLLLRLLLSELRHFNRRQLQPLIGERVCDILDTVLDRRAEDVGRGLDALRLQYPEHAQALEKRFLTQLALRLELQQIQEIYAEGLIGRELFENLQREHKSEQLSSDELPPLDLGLNTAELLTQFDMFKALNQAELKGLARFFTPRLAIPGEKIISKGTRGTAMYFISSGAVELVLKERRIRLGRGQYFGEMAILARRPREVDIVAIGYCQLLVLTATDLERFFKTFPKARAEIFKTFEERTQFNEENEQENPQVNRPEAAESVGS